jgi:hypothetical protein
MVDLEELRKQAEANKVSVCDPCKQEVTEIKNVDTRITSVVSPLSPHERRLQRARLALGDPLPHGQHRCAGEPLRICVVDDLGQAKFVDPRIVVTAKGMALRYGGHMGGVRGDC